MHNHMIYKKEFKNDLGSLGVSASPVCKNYFVCDLVNTIGLNALLNSVSGLLIVVIKKSNIVLSKSAHRLRENIELVKCCMRILIVACSYEKKKIT